MNDINYIEGIVKILETPKQKFFTNNIVLTQFRAQFPQMNNTRIINLTFWGNLAHDVKSYYKVNDYVLIEGYLSLRNKNTLDITPPSLKKIDVTVLKVYPFLLNYHHSN